MASIEKRSRVGHFVWRAHYRTPAGEQRSKTFDRRRDAERLLATVESDKSAGSFADPARGRVTISDWSTHWLQSQTHLKPSTQERYAGILREHVVPRWGRIKLSELSHGDVQGWISELSKARSPATVRKIHRVLSLVLAMAVRDGRLARNVADGVHLPQVTKGQRQYLTHKEVERLAEACARHGESAPNKHRRLDERYRDDYRLIVLMLAYTGPEVRRTCSTSCSLARLAETTRGHR